MTTKLMLPKGYTISVYSWENDGDNYQRITKTYETEEEALLVYNACIYVSDNRLGGQCKDDDKWSPVQVELLKAFYKKNNIDYAKGEWDSIEDSMEEIVNPVLGKSEWYIFRELETIELSFSPINVYSKILKQDKR